VLKRVKVSRTILEADKVINLPVLKVHCQAKLTCGMKNLMGVISDSEKRRFHSTNLDSAVFELNTIIRPTLNICDAIVGDLTFEEGGTPVKFGRVFASQDIFAFDCYAANTVGYDSSEIGYLCQYSRFYRQNMDYELIHLNEPLDLKDFKAIDYTSRYRCGIYPKKACCSCLASVFLALEGKGQVPGDINFFTGMGILESDIKRKGRNFFIGKCTRKYGNRGTYIKGCPPNAADVRRVIK
jgi:hypothetical protein